MIKPKSLKWHSEAVQDLRQIRNYCRSRYSEQVAEAVILRIRRNAKLLLDFPELGKIYFDEAGEQVNGIRYLVDSGLRIAYSVVGEAVVIIAVFDPRQDISKFKPENRIQS